MSETNNSDRPRDGARKPLSLSRGGGRAGGSGGRGATVEVVKKRKLIKPGGEAAAAPSAKPQQAKDQGKPVSKIAEAAAKLGLSEEEFRARQVAILKAKKESAEREARHKAEEEERSKRAEAEAKALEEKRRLEELAEREKALQAERESAEPEGEAADQPRGDAAAPAAAARADRADQDRPAPRPQPKAAEAPAEDRSLSDLGGRIKAKKPLAVPAKPAAKPRAEPRRRGKLTIASATADEDERQRSLASVRRARERERQRRTVSGSQDREKVTREVVIPEAITVAELANRMAERAVSIIKYLMQEGQMVRANDILDADTAELIVEEFGHKVKRVSEADVEEGFIGADDADTSMQTRPPVVTVMGHVDHGKTSLLDALRSTDVVSGEAGGITQHIGAYQVNLESGEKITFIDTPGHAAFSAMRARGANVTDIVVLVVAADDGVMPQTVEAISHAKAANAPIIVAVNKIDVAGADPQKVLTDLLQHDVQVEAMGGEVQAIEVSALKRINLEGLTEAITLQAELLELRANPNRSAEGVVVESQLDKGRGPVATVLVKRGTLRRGDIVVAGRGWGKIRALVNERGQQLDEAGPSTPVELLGLSEPPDPGEPFAVVENEARAREITAYRERQIRQKKGAAASVGASLEQMLAKLKESENIEIPILIKADTQGSAEAISGALDKLGNKEVRARVIHQAVGGISESDVLLAKASGAPILGFNVRANKQALSLAEQEGVEIRYYAIIYDLVDDMRALMEDRLAPERREDFLGNARIKEVFNITKVGKVAGCEVTEGVVQRGAKVRLLRDDVVIHEGDLQILKRFKDDVNEVQSGMECGMRFANYEDIRQGDIIECFTVREVKRSLADAAAG